MRHTNDAAFSARAINTALPPSSTVSPVGCFVILISPAGEGDGDGVTVYGRYQDWYVVSHGEHLGYVSAPFIRLS